MRKIIILFEIFFVYSLQRQYFGVNLQCSGIVKTREITNEEKAVYGERNT